MQTTSHDSTDSIQISLQNLNGVTPNRGYAFIHSHVLYHYGNQLLWVSLLMPHTHTHTHTTVLLLFWNLSATTQVSRYQKGKTRKVITNLDLLEQEIVSGSGICWATCKSAPHPRQPRQHPTTQSFTGRMPFLLPNQQRQSTESKF